MSTLEFQIEVNYSYSGPIYTIQLHLTLENQPHKIYILIRELYDHSSEKYAKLLVL